MLLIILILAGVALAVNRTQQASKTPAQSLSIPAVLAGIFGPEHSMPVHLTPEIRGPGIGAGLDANNTSTGTSQMVSAGPYFYRPLDQNPPVTTPSAPTSAPSGGGAGGGGSIPPSGGYSAPGGPRGLNTL